tara:strand:+ start:330 stop:533 length:204 start_codon:yes stop_codon:yes gene_type:complete
MGINVISGYASLSINGRWVGVIAGNIYCNKSRKTEDKALNDAKELYNKFNRYENDKSRRDTRKTLSK